jgi:hypothetical protein
MRFATILLAFFVGVLLNVQHTSASLGKQTATPAAKETKLQGTIIHLNKDKATMQIRGGASPNATEMRNIVFDTSTEWTKQGKPADQAEFKEGEFVIVLGKIDDKGVLHATRIDLRLPR